MRRRLMRDSAPAISECSSASTLENGTSKVSTRSTSYAKSRSCFPNATLRSPSFRQDRQSKTRTSYWQFGLAPRRMARKIYPESLPYRRELEFASGVFNSIEINGSFYSLQRPSSYQRWYSATPPDFRFIAHMKKLRDIETPLANFFDSGVLALHEKIGPILWQLPPNLAFDPKRL